MGDSRDRTATGSTSGPTTVSEVQHDIEQTRDDLAHTVDQLAAKLDVKSRVRERIGETPTSWAVGAAAGASLLMVLVLWRRHRTSTAH